jgi:SAM-dependent methyltransferase
MVRESSSCVHCGSSVRLREVVAAVSREILGTQAPARDWPVRDDLVGIGFSDSEIYSPYLARATSYTNTWFHQDPRVDVTDLASFAGRRYDFAVCSDILEHVPAPADGAFGNLFAILNPGGTLVFNVPMRDGRTVEHYPELTTFDTFEESNGWALSGTRPDGSEFRANGVVFHGGPGTTAEMRIFGRDDVRRLLDEAGFVEVVEHQAEDEEAGIVHERTPEFLDTPGGRVVGMHAGVWTARRPPSRA